MKGALLDKSKDLSIEEYSLCWFDWVIIYGGQTNGEIAITETSVISVNSLPLLRWCIALYWNHLL